MLGPKSYLIWLIQGKVNLDKKTKTLENIRVKKISDYVRIYDPHSMLPLLGILC